MAAEILAMAPMGYCETLLLTQVDQSQHPLCPDPDRDVLIGLACWCCHLHFASLAPLHPCDDLGPWTSICP